MTAGIHNLAWMSTTTTGTGTITLGTAVAPWLTFAQAGVQDGETVSYSIFDPPNSECGRGVYHSSGTTLTRGPISSTNSNAAISLSGNAQVFIAALAQDIGQGCWQAVDVICASDGTSPTTTMRLNASYLVLFNPTDGSTKRLAPADMTQNLSCAISSMAAGARDQSSAYTANADVWFYWMWGATTGLNTINSLTAPASGGPSMPAGYTHFCPAFPLKIAAGPVIASTLPQGGSTKIEVCDRTVMYDNVPEFIGVGYPSATFDLSAWVPAAAKLTNLELDAELHSGSGALIAGAVLNTPNGNLINMSLYTVATGWCAMNVDTWVRLPSNRHVTQTFLISAGTPDDDHNEIFLKGYTF